MSNPTTPFSWQMPTATDLVTDLPADFEVFGQAVATSMADLLGGTSGQILAKNSNTDMDFVWIANDQGDITGITATAPLTGGGSSGAVTVGIQDALTTQKGAVQLSDSTSTTSSILAATPTAVKAAYDLADGAIAKSTVTTAGDVIYRNATVPVRLGIGTAGQVLTVNSGATAPQWSTPASGGGMTSIASGSLSGSNVSLTSIVGTYKNLQLVVRDFYFSVDTSLNIRLNNDTGSNYRSTGTLNLASGGGPNIVIGGQNNAMEITNTSVDNADNNNSAIFELFDYADGTSQKLSSAMTTFTSDGYGRAMTNQVYAYYPVSAITRIDIFPASGTFSGGTYVLYGVN